MALEFWRNRRVLLTGHTGFKGAWLCLWLQRLGAQVTGIALPPNTKPSLFEILGPWRDLESRMLDIGDRAATVAAIESSKAEILIHLAAQSLVLEGHRDPPATFATNVMGTVHLLEGAFRASALRAVLVVTTDKVYANAEHGRPFREGDPLGGDEPYGASKAAAELVAAAYRRKFADAKKALATVRAGNVIGGGDWAQHRLIPDLVRALAEKEPTAIRNPQAVRPWQHVLDPLAGYLVFAERLANGVSGMPTALNFGPPAENSRTVAETLKQFLVHFPEHPGYRAATATGAHEATLLRLDSALAQQSLGWRPRLKFANAVDWTAGWYRRHQQGGDMRAASLDQLARYEALP
jgi:CDP-glucose 4,6-dehydratase